MVPIVGRDTSLDADESKCKTGMANDVDVRIVVFFAVAITDGHDDDDDGRRRGLAPKIKNPLSPCHVEISRTNSTAYMSIHIFERSLRHSDLRPETEDIFSYQQVSTHIM